MAEPKTLVDSQAAVDLAHRLRRMVVTIHDGRTDDIERAADTLALLAGDRDGLLHQLEQLRTDIDRMATAAENSLGGLARMESTAVTQHVREVYRIVAAGLRNALKAGA